MKHKTQVLVSISCFLCQLLSLVPSLSAQVPSQLQSSPVVKLTADSQEKTGDLYRLLAGLGAELWIGSAIVGGVCGAASYFIARSGVVRYRERRRQRILRRQLYRSKLQRNPAAR